MHRGVHGWQLQGGRGRSGSRGEEEGGRGHTHGNGQGMVLLWVCTGCDAALAMVIVLHWITGDEVDVDLSEDLVEATVLT
jgi:hypothetical protein